MHANRASHFPPNHSCSFSFLRITVKSNGGTSRTSQPLHPVCVWWWDAGSAAAGSICSRGASSICEGGPRGILERGFPEMLLYNGGRCLPLGDCQGQCACWEPVRFFSVETGKRIELDRSLPLLLLLNIEELSRGCTSDFLLVHLGKDGGLRASCPRRLKCAPDLVW